MNRYQHRVPRVFVLPVFEIKSGSTIPKNKSELVEKLQRGDAVVFHKSFCASCHTVPEFEKWIKAPIKGKESSIYDVRLIKRLSDPSTYHVCICICLLVLTVSHKSNFLFSDGLSVFHTSKREASLWEPFYIGTHREPLFEERLSWEGRKDKITQVSGTFII